MNSKFITQTKKNYSSIAVYIGYMIFYMVYLIHLKSTFMANLVYWPRQISVCSGYKLFCSFNCRLDVIKAGDNYIAVDVVVLCLLGT